MPETIPPARERGGEYDPMDCPICGFFHQYGDWPCERCDYAPYRDGPFTWTEDSQIRGKGEMVYRAEKTWVPETEVP